MWMMSCTRSARARRIWGIFKKSVSWVESSRVLSREKSVDFRLLTEALRRCRMIWGGGRWKSQNRMNVYLSPYVEEPLNSKLIKSFVPELRSRKCFSCFEIPIFYVYMRYEHYIHFTYPYLAMIYIYIYIYIYLIYHQIIFVKRQTISMKYSSVYLILMSQLDGKRKCSTILCWLYACIITFDSTQCTHKWQIQILPLP